MAVLKPLPRLDQTREEQVNAIEESFQFANDYMFIRELKHPRNPKAKVKEILSILPEFDTDAIAAHCHFLGDPWEGKISDIDDPGEKKKERICKTILSPIVSGNEKFLMMYMPSAETAERISNIRSYDDCDGNSYTYKWINDYIMEKEPPLPRHSQILFTERYAEDETKEKYMAYVPFTVKWTLKRKRQTERVRMPENYGKATYLNHSYLTPDKSEYASKISELTKYDLHEDEIELIMTKRCRIERPDQMLEANQDIIHKADRYGTKC